MKARGFRHGQHPAHFTETLLGVNQVRDRHDVRLVLCDPVETGEAGVDGSVLNVTGHFLGANQETIDFGIGGGGEIGAAIGVGGKPGAGEQLQRCFLQAAFGNADAEFHRISFGAAG